MANPTPQNGKGYSVNIDTRNPRRDEICDFLDSFNDLEKFCEVKPSTLLKGGWYAMLRENRLQNLDWMAQSAHSFREIHYGILDSKSFTFKFRRFLIQNVIKFFKYKPVNIPKDRRDRISDSLKTYIADEAKRQEISTAINKVHIAFTKIAHHFKERDSLKDTLKILVFLKITQDGQGEVEHESYEKLVDIFENLILDIKPKGLLSHKIIDEIFSKNNFDEKIIKANCFSGINLDTRRYFFSKADEAWLKWIWEKGLLDQLKKPALDVSGYSYRLPELEYLTRMAEKDPQTVVEIINSVPILRETFNPEVVDRFFWITGLLPVKQIRVLFPKIMKENWVSLMAPFQRSGYEYLKIVGKLKEEKDFEAIIDLAKIILTLRTKEELHNIEGFSLSGKLFYLSDITETGIFELLLSPENDKKEKTLGVILEILSKVATYGKDKDEEVFSASEPFYLLDVDLFTMELNTGRKSYTKDDIENLIATAKKLIEDVFSSVRGNPIETQRIYTSYISILPDSKTLYRLKLFAITRCPDLFKEEIKNTLFRIFNVGERYFEIEGGAEYHHAIISGFGALSDSTKRDYVAKVLEYFGANLDDKDKEVWRKRDGLKILIYIKNELNKEEIAKAESLLGKFPEGNIPAPHPDSSGVMGGMVSHRSPFELADYSVPEIIEHIKTDWSPEVLNEQFKNDDFLNPRGVEGLGDALKDNLKIRIMEYFTNLGGFFDRECINPNYVYSLLRGIEEMLRDKKTLSDEQYDLLISFFDSIRISGESKEFEKSNENSWLGDWITVHKIVADISVELLASIKDSEVFKKNRSIILSAIKYLLTIKNNPDVEDDKRESNEPFHVAINSVRGRAYQAFAQFVYCDGKILANDVKEIYEEILNRETSNAVRFVIGHYLPTFYYKDTPYIVSLLPRIFPINDAEKEKLYFATWEGYLASSLYKELFVELSKYYEHAIGIKAENYPERKYLKGLDETLATHLSLAYAHLDLKINDPLFDLFWKTPNETRHYEFVSFIGRSCISRDQAGDKWFEENGVSKQKLIDLWNWILKTDIPIETKTYSGFGFWINPNKEIVDEKILVKNLADTLQKSEGNIDWDYGLTQRLKVFAEIDQKNTLEIIKNYLLLDGELSPHRRSPMFSLETEIKEALVIIYKETTLKKPVEELINILIEKGSSSFWGLKDVLN